MLACPNCSSRLKRQPIKKGVVYACPTCGGRSMGIGLLHTIGIEQSFMRDLWKKAMLPDTPRMRICPHCGCRMAEVRSDLDANELVLDLCTSCQSIWFDPREDEAIPLAPKQPSEKELPEEAKLALARAEIENWREIYEAKNVLGDPPSNVFQKAATFLGLPAVIDDDESLVRPYMIWGLALVCIIVYFFSRHSIDALALRYGFISEIWYRKGGLTLITSFFLHENILHLIINMYFLLIFGDHIEGLLGRWRLLALIFGSHLAGLMLHNMAFPHSTIPLIGASGGIAGVLAYYTVSFPRAKVAMIWGSLSWGIYWTRIPVLFYLAFFIFGQITPSLMNIGGRSHVAYLAHIGGLTVGICAALWARTKRGSIVR